MNALESFGLNKSTIIKYYLAQIVSILLYLKKMGVIHRDIKVSLPNLVIKLCINQLV
jgi:serine/threonine protein kinase